MSTTTLGLTKGDVVIVKQSSQRHNPTRFACGDDAPHATFLRMDKRDRFVVQFGNKTRRLRIGDILIHATREANNNDVREAAICRYCESPVHNVEGGCACMPVTP